jgi:hypothetical protein
MNDSINERLLLGMFTAEQINMALRGSSRIATIDIHTGVQWNSVRNISDGHHQRESIPSLPFRSLACLIWSFQRQVANP